MHLNQSVCKASKILPLHFMKTTLLGSNTAMFSIFWRLNLVWSIIKQQPKYYSTENKSGVLPRSPWNINTGKWNKNEIAEFIFLTVSKPQGWSYQGTNNHEVYPPYLTICYIKLLNWPPSCHSIDIQFIHPEVGGGSMGSWGRRWHFQVSCLGWNTILATAGLLSLAGMKYCWVGPS